jgi:hypothetical protein
MKVELKRKERIIYCCVVVVLKKEEKKIDKTFVRVMYLQFVLSKDLLNMRLIVGRLLFMLVFDP